LTTALLPSFPTATTRTDEQRAAPVANAAVKEPVRDALTLSALAEPDTVAVTRARSRDLKCEPTTVSGVVFATRREARRAEPEPAANAEMPRASTAAAATIPIRYIRIRREYASPQARFETLHVPRRSEVRSPP